MHPMTTQNKPQITIYTDGGCRPNPGPGGWGALLLDADDNPLHEMSGGAPDTTNNRMELSAVCHALESLDTPHTITLFTDSAYLRNGITKWIHGWIKKDFKGIKNEDLWRRLHRASKRHEIDWRWVKGHAGNVHNERVDQLATAEIDKQHAEQGIGEDTGYDADVVVYTASSGDKARPFGAWAAIIVGRDGTVSEYSAFLTDVTVNRILLEGALALLEDIDADKSVVFTSSANYLIQGMRDWLPGWLQRVWRSSTGKAVANQDLWQRLHNLTQGRDIQWEYLKPKANPHQERLDQLLKAEHQENRRG